MRVFLSPVHEVFADELQFVVDSAWSGDVRLQRVLEGGGECADDAAVKEAGGGTVFVALALVLATRQVVEERWRMKEGLQRRVEVASVAHVEHPRAGRARAPIADFYGVSGKEHDLGRRNNEIECNHEASEHGPDVFQGRRHRRYDWRTMRGGGLYMHAVVSRRLSYLWRGWSRRLIVALRTIFSPINTFGFLLWLVTLVPSRVKEEDPALLKGASEVPDGWIEGDASRQQRLFGRGDETILQGVGGGGRGPVVPERRGDRVCGRGRHRVESQQSRATRKEERRRSMSAFFRLHLTAACDVRAPPGSCTSLGLLCWCRWTCSG